MTLQKDTPTEVCELCKELQESETAFSYFDAADRLVLWNEAYVDLNIRIRHQIRKGALFPDLLSELVAAGQIRIPNEKADEWIARRVSDRKYGRTALRQLADGRVFLVQERRNSVGGTLGFWIDVTSVCNTGEQPNAPIQIHGAEAPLSDPGQQDLMRTLLQVVLGNLELLATKRRAHSNEALISGALDAACTLRGVLDEMR